MFDGLHLKRPATCEWLSRSFKVTTVAAIISMDHIRFPTSLTLQVHRYLHSSRDINTYLSTDTQMTGQIVEYCVADVRLLSNARQIAGHAPACWDRSRQTCCVATDDKNGAGCTMPSWLRRHQQRWNRQMWSQWQLGDWRQRTLILGAELNV